MAFGDFLIRLILPLFSLPSSPRALDEVAPSQIQSFVSVNPIIKNFFYRAVLCTKRKLEPFKKYFRYFLIPFSYVHVE